MIGEPCGIIALLHRQAWDEATRDEWAECWDRAWEETDEREQASRS